MERNVFPTKRETGLFKYKNQKNLPKHGKIISDKLNLNYYQKSGTDENRSSDKNNTIRLNSTERYSARKHDSETVQSGTLLFLKQTNP